MNVAGPDLSTGRSTAIEPEDDQARASRQRLAAMLLFMGTLHFVVPKAFERLIPSWLPGTARFWARFSGVWELASGALLLRPETKRAGGYAATATMIAVFPGNIKMAFDAGAPRDAKALGAWLRLPLQIPLVAWGVRQTRV